MNHGYSRGTAAVYDDAVGYDWFRRTVVRFARIVWKYGVKFRNAADVGCGTGLFARYLNRCWGVPVVAVDLSRGMLAEARRRCRCLPGITLLHQDVRRLALPHQVDLITANFDMLNHLANFDSLRAACQSIAANLRPRGWFYFDLLTPCLPLGRFDVVVRRVAIPCGKFEQRAVWLPGRRLLGVQASVVIRRGSCTARVADWHTERAFGPEEIGAALAEAGFIIRAVHDENTLRPLRRCTQRVIILAQKGG